MIMDPTKGKGNLHVKENRFRKLGKWGRHPNDNFFFLLKIRRKKMGGGEPSPSEKGESAPVIKETIL